MKKKIELFYKISKEAGMAEDDDGNPIECYMRLKFTLRRPMNEKEIEEEKEKIQEDAMKSAAEFLGIDVSLIKIVTEEEYISETD